MRNVLGLIPHLRTAKNLFILSTVVTILGSTTLAGIRTVLEDFAIRGKTERISGERTRKNEKVLPLRV